VDITTYEYTFYIIHQTTKHLSNSSQPQTQSVFEILGEIDDNWARLNKTYQQSTHFAGKVRLKTIEELEREKSPRDQVPFHTVALII
jgi:hypothetical protein